MKFFYDERPIPKSYFKEKMFHQEPRFIYFFPNFIIGQYIKDNL